MNIDESPKFETTLAIGSVMNTPILSQDKKLNQHHEWDQLNQYYDSLPDSTLLDPLPSAAILGLSPYALQAWRTTGRYNLPFVKVGRRIKYRLGDLRQFLTSRTKTHTGSN